MKKLIVFAVLLALIASAAAIPLLEDKRPADVPKDANVTLNYSSAEAPVQAAVATDVTIERIVPASVSAGGTFTVILKVSNNYNKELSILVVDPQRQGITYIGGPEPYMVQYDGLAIPLFRWTGKIAAGETKEYSYQIKAGSPGSITFPPASVNDDYGNTFESRPMHVTVECKPDGTCNNGETYVSCPQDCPTGSKDDTCDGAADGRIDPDCEASAEPDTGKVVTETTLPAETGKPAGICNLIMLPILTLLTAILTRRI